MWIGGEWVEAVLSKTFTVGNPATEEEIAELPPAPEAILTGVRI